MNLKSQQVQKYWGKSYKNISYSQIDVNILKKFKGSHPKVVQEWLPNNSGLFGPDPLYKLTQKQKKHRIMLKFESFFGIDLSKKHYKLVK